MKTDPRFSRDAGCEVFTGNELLGDGRRHSPSDWLPRLMRRRRWLRRALPQWHAKEKTSASGIVKPPRKPPAI